MTLGGIVAVMRVETTKLARHPTTGGVIATCVAGPFAFAAAILVQNVVPEDTLFGRAIRESGFALSLTVLGFATLWVIPVLSSIVGGDIFSAEDRYGTWPMVLTRSRARDDLFAGKVLVAFGFTSAAISVLAASSIAAGAMMIGTRPLIDLSGALVQPAAAVGRIAAAWASVLPPALALAGIAVLISIVTRASAAGIGVPVLIAVAMQLAAYIDGPDAPRRLLLAPAFNAWHGIMTDPPYYGPLIRGVAVSAVYLILMLAIAYRVMRRRDVS